MFAGDTGEIGAYSFLFSNGASVMDGAEVLSQRNAKVNIIVGVESYIMCWQKFTSTCMAKTILLGWWVKRNNA